MKERLVAARVDDLAAVDARDRTLDAGLPGCVSRSGIHPAGDDADGDARRAKSADRDGILLVHDAGVAEQRAVQIDSEQLRPSAIALSLSLSLRAHALGASG